MVTSQPLIIPGMSFVDAFSVASVKRVFRRGEINKAFPRGEMFPGTDLRISSLSGGFRSSVLDELEAGYKTPGVLLKSAVRSLGLYTMDKGRGDREIINSVGEQGLATLDDLLDIFLKPAEERERILVRGIETANLIPMRLPGTYRAFCVDIRIKENHVLFSVVHGKCEKNSRVIVSYRGQSAA